MPENGMPMKPTESIGNEQYAKPLYEISGLEALAIHDANPVAHWGRRDEPNRVEPIATPEFDTAFQFEAGESIFTIGSCFARNIEQNLMELGFDVPIRNLFKRPDFLSINPAVINNFGTPSIYNELSWALDPDAHFDTANNIVEIANGKYIDLHVIPSERPASFEKIVSIRKALTEVTKAVARCRVVIMTLGLVELWYDIENQLYLNATLMPSLIRKYPGRFSLRVLDFNTTKYYLDRALDVLKHYSRPDQQILLTVSPVPMSSTFRNQDVMVANTYSKSLLRTVTEHIVMERPNVHYFPSYESIILSDRKEAFQNDMKHVTDKLIKLNIRRMTDAYIRREKSVDDALMEMANDDISILLARANEYLERDQETGLQFLKKFACRFPESAELTFVAASSYFRWSLFDEALSTLALIPDDWNPLKRNLLAARIYNRKAGYAQVLPLVETILADNARVDGAWDLLVTARAHLQGYEQAREALMEWTKVSYKRTQQGLLTLAQAMEGISSDKAIECYQRAFALQAPTSAQAIRLAEALFRADRYDEMRALLVDMHFEEFAFERRRLALLESI